jgi:hypothetical protein
MTVHEWFTNKRKMLGIVFVFSSWMATPILFSDKIMRALLITIYKSTCNE